MDKILLRVRDRETIWLVLVICIGICIRLVAIIVYHHVPESDEKAYLSMALSFVSGHGIIDYMGNRAMYNVGYPLFVLSPAIAIFGNDLLAARLVNTALGAVSIALCYAIAKEVGAGSGGRVLAAAMWALYLPGSIYVVYLFKENLMIPLMLGLIWSVLCLAKRSSYAHAVAAGALFGLLALTGNAALSFAVPAVVALAFTPASVRRRISLVAVIAILAVAVAAPWMIRNERVLGAPVLNTNGGFNLYLGNNPSATGMFGSIANTPRGSSWHSLRKEGEVKASETLFRGAIAWIKDNPYDFVTLALKKGVYFWTPPFHRIKDSGSWTESLTRILWSVQFVLLLAAAAGGLFLATQRNRSSGILGAAIASYTFVHMIFYVIDRYRVPIMPYVCVMAALTVEALYGRLTAATRVPFRPGGQEIRQSVLSSGVERASEGRCAVGPRANGGRR